MNTLDLKKNTKEELIIYIEKLSRDMTKLQEENLELRRKCQVYIHNMDDTDFYKRNNNSNIKKNIKL